MGIILEVEDAGFTGYIDDGMPYNARCIGVELKTKPFTDDKTGEPVKKFEFKFKLMSDDEHDGQFLWGETPSRVTNHPDNKFRNWAESITGQRMPALMKVNTDDLVDRDCMVVVGKDVKERNGQEKTRNYIREVHPTREAAARLAAQDSEDPF